MEFYIVRIMLFVSLVGLVYSGLQLARVCGENKDTENIAKWMTGYRKKVGR